MSHSTPATPADSALTEGLLRAFALLAYGFGVANLFHAWWIDRSRWTLLLFLVFEAYSLLLVLIARRALRRDASPAAMALTIYAALYFVLLDPHDNRRLIADVGFLCVNFSWRNAAILGVLYAVQVLRIRREEAVLAGSAAYRDYQQRVRWRLLPFVY